MEAEIERRLACLTLEQKVRLVTGGAFYSLAAEPAVGLRRIVVSDGPAGVRGEQWDERRPATNLPSPTALAATWDEERVAEVGRLLAAEARQKGVDVLLAPNMNMQRSPYGGRHFECFSEDPLLSGRIGAALVRGIQDGGVAATAKHFVANDSETARWTLDAQVDERTLRELYLAPFEAVLRAGGAWAVIAAYNSVNGELMTQSPLLAEVLKGEWGYDGLVMSDWYATRSVEAAANGGLDLAMPGPDSPWQQGLVAAVTEGRVDEKVIDEKVRRILRLAARVGALDGLPHHAAPRRYSSGEAAAMVRGAAAAGFVLAENDGVLPLDRGALRRVAVIGPNAAVGCHAGGGSATVYSAYKVAPLDGLRAALGESAEVQYALGTRVHKRIPAGGSPWIHRPDGGGPGVEVRFLAEDGTLLASEHRPSAGFTWLGSFSAGVPDEQIATVEVRTRLIATEAGGYTVGASGVGRYLLKVDGRTAFDVSLELPPGADDAEALTIPPQQSQRIQLSAGEEVQLELVHDVRTSPDFGTILELNVEAPFGTDEEELSKAVALARGCEVAIVVVGTTREFEGEGFDRTSLSLPGRQDELVRRVAAVNPRTVVVVNAGSPVLMPWAEEVGAVLIVWFPGQEFGNALADVLLGDAEPGGRLPATWPRTEEGLPSTQLVNGVVEYAEGLYVGYRGRDGIRRPRPRYPFGHGHGYTTWEYGDVLVPDAAVPGEDLPVRVPIRNTGGRAGRGVVQVYLSRRETSVPRPARWLAGFAGVDLPADGAATVEIAVPARAFAHWDTGSAGWRIEPGRFELHVGASAEDLRSTATVEYASPTAQP